VYRSGSSGIVETLVIPGRGASSSHIIRLYSKEELPLESDSYTLALQAVDGSTKDTRSSTLTCRLILHDGGRNELERNGKEKKGDYSVKNTISEKIHAEDAAAAHTVEDSI
jgi:hypothetical protein